MEINHQDYWQSSEAQLRQPGLQIADYVESEGIRVPKRYANLEDAVAAVKAGSTIVISSEHPSEYDGHSGLLQSYFVDLNRIDDGREEYERYGRNALDIDHEVHASGNRSYYTGNKDPKPGYGSVAHMVISQIAEVSPDITINRLKAMQIYHYPLQRYLDITNPRTMPSFIDEMSYSYWEYIPGHNVTVAADDARDNRYHMLVSSRNEKMLYGSGVIVNEGGEVLQGDLPDEIAIDAKTTQDIVRTYEAVRNLGRFSSQNCAIMKMQVDGEGKPWFLKYHRSRDLNLVTDTLSAEDFPADDGWHKANGVRGSLDSPVTLQTALWYPERYGSRRHVALRIPDTEHASTDWHYDYGLSEVLTSRRRCYVADGPLPLVYARTTWGENPRNRWFKPQVAMAIDDKGLNTIIGREIKDMVSNTVHRRNGMARVVLDLASDGLNGYIRLNPDSEQPVYSAS